MSSHHSNYLGHILELGVDEHADKVNDEKGPEEAEQVNPKLISHWQLVPANTFADPSFAASVVVDVLARLKSFSCATLVHNNCSCVCDHTDDKIK